MRCIRKGDPDGLDAPKLLSRRARALLDYALEHLRMRKRLPAWMAPVCADFTSAKEIGYNGHMEKATVSKLKDNLSAYLRKVRAGHAVVIYDRDVPIARLERIESTGRGSDRLALLLAQGVTRPPLRALTAAKVRALLAKPIDRPVGLLDALELDRSEDR
jgi:antitoxin (DNA-binding transcriptional repressor) of toxin-antitoxin stability system